MCSDTKRRSYWDPNQGFWMGKLLHTTAEEWGHILESLQERVQLSSDDKQVQTNCLQFCFSAYVLVSGEPTEGLLRLHLRNFLDQKKKEY